MAFVDQAALSRDSIFVERVRVAMLVAAANVQAEAGGTANHANRANYAKLVLNAPETYAHTFANAVAATNGSIVAGSTDSDIQFVVNGLWSAMAGTI